MSSWKINDYKCINDECIEFNVIKELLHKQDQQMTCSFCKEPLQKQITANWSQGRHHSVSTWRVGL